MFKLTGIGVKNLRSLRDTGVVQIKPITMLVGRNSSGKSSFARLFPLLKQSAERRKQAPVLWFGRLVDFGSFGEAVSSFSREKEIDLLFRFSCPANLDLTRRRNSVIGDEVEQLNASIDLSLRLGTDGDETRTVLRELSLSIFGSAISIRFNGFQYVLSIDGVPVAFPNNSSPHWTLGTILPQLRALIKEPHGPTSAPDDLIYTMAPLDRVFVDELRESIAEFLHGKSGADRKDHIAEHLPIASIEDLYARCLELNSAPERWRTLIAALSPVEDERFRRLHRALLMSRLGALLSELDEELERSTSGIGYLEPLRATAQRYYRREEISTDEIDPKGLNITFFLQGLSTRDRESLNEWLNGTLGFTLSVKSSGGHASLHIQTSEQVSSRNMADVGLGYSQIAPVAIQLWAAMRKNINTSTNRGRFPLRRLRQIRSIVVVEQPELHLHPAYQAKLADVFAACVRPDVDNREGTRTVDLIAETHSPNLINRVGELVAAGRLSPDDVQVILFDPDPSLPGASVVHTSTYSEDGVLQNWPLGFFDS